MKIFKILAVFLLLTSVASAQNVKSLSVSDLQCGRDGSVFFVTMKVNPKTIKNSINQRLEIVPVISSADSSKTVELPPVILAGKNMYYSTLRNESADRINFLHRAGKGDIINYSERVIYEDWMEDCIVSLDARQTGCCGTTKGEFDVPVARVNLKPRSFNAAFSYVAPLDTAEKRFNLSGRANIRFIVNRTNIDWKYANNYVELDSILRTVNAVKENPDASVELIKLTGYASPEGPYDNNVRLAKGRVEVVKEYVRNNSPFPAEVYKTESVPEDWEGFKEWLKTCSLSKRDEMIAFIDDPKVPIRTKNEAFMKRFPQDYPFILANVYPPLRHTDYLITYKVKKYYTVEEIKAVFNTRPENLSLNELFILANSYTPGSPEYDDVFDVAVSMFPKDKVANLNAANSAMNRDQYKLAEKYLGNAGEDAEVYYARGVLNALQGKYDDAINWFDKAEKNGKSEAKAEIAKIKDIQANKAGVTYLTND